MRRCGSPPSLDSTEMSLRVLDHTHWSVTEDASQFSVASQVQRQNINVLCTGLFSYPGTVTVGSRIRSTNYYTVHI